MDHHVSHQPLWWSGEKAMAHLSPEAMPTSCDVLIVGAGLTGLTAAYTLAKAGKSVLCIDSGNPGEGASSRNGGMLGGGHRLSLEQMQSRFGSDIALRLLREAHVESGEFAVQLMQQENMDCDFQPCGRLRAFWHENEYDATAKSTETLSRLIGVSAHMVSAKDIHQEIQTDVYKGGVVFETHGGLNPAKWTEGLLRAAIERGAQVHGQTAALQIEQSNGSLSVTTTQGAVQAGQVLMATNGYTQRIFPTWQHGIIPIPSFIIATEPLDKALVSRLFPTGRMITETRTKHCYFRPSPDGTRVVFGARAAMSDISEKRALSELRALLTQIFPELNSTRITHSWRGNTGFSFNTLPNVGNTDGVWHAMGYSGNGNTMAPYLGHKVALQMLGDSNGDTAFSHTQFKKPWWYQGRPWFLPVMDRWLRTKEALSQFR